MSTPADSTTRSWLFPPATREVQFDEKWSDVYKKQAHCDPLDPADDHRGDCWDHVAIDPEVHLVLAVMPGARDVEAVEGAGGRGRDAGGLRDDGRGWGGVGQVEGESADQHLVSFVERQNATDRYRNARKVRKTYTFSKDWTTHHAFPPEGGVSMDLR